MFEEAKTVVAGLTRRLASVEPERLSDEEAGAALVLAVEIERLGAGLRLLVARRAAEGSCWREEGHRSEAGWVAAVCGTPVAEARSALETSAFLAELPATRDALRSGRLSPAQARAVAVAAAADPRAEDELLLAAGMLSVEGLQGFARDVRATAAEPVSEQRAMLSRRRNLRFWTEADGMLHFAGAVPTDSGAELVAAVRSRAAFVADEALAAGLEPEPQEAYDADALVALATGDTRTATFAGNAGGGARQATIVVHTSVRHSGGDQPGSGGTEAGERCEIPGVGPVPLTTVESLLGDATVQWAVGNAAGGYELVDLGPAVEPEADEQLEARDPKCVVPGCPNTLSLVTDYWSGASALFGPPDLASLARLCRPHHRQKTHEGFVLSGGPGRWEWRGPP